MVHDDDSHFDVFVSYRHSDREVVRPLARALAAAGLRIWIDEVEVSDFQSLSLRIRTGLARSKVLLAWYSKTYPDSRACQWELTTAFLSSQRASNDPRQRVIVVNPETSNTHIHPIELRDAKFLVNDTSEHGRDALVPRIAEHISHIHGYLAARG